MSAGSEERLCVIVEKGDPVVEELRREPQDGDIPVTVVGVDDLEEWRKNPEAMRWVGEVLERFRKIIKAQL